MSIQKHLPFNRPCLVGQELAYVTTAIENGWISGDGSFTKKCEALLAQRLGVPRVLLTTSCTHALEMAALLLDVKPGDEVILPSYTFVSTANAFALRGAKPVFADIHPETLNMDEGLIEKLISSRTRAIVPVHYAGVGCNLAELEAIAQRHGLAIIEDNAHGLFGRYRGRYLGTFGCAATLSFHETKNITCGEGGALILNDLELISRAEIIRAKGTNRNEFFRGQTDKYTWVDLGSSYPPSDLLAAFLYAQLECASEIRSRRKRVWEYYFSHLQEWATHRGVRLPMVPEECEQTYHMFYLILPSLAARQGFIAHLVEHGIASVFHYVPLHLSPMGRKYGTQPGDCPVSEEISERLVRIPFFNNLTEEEQARVVSVIKEFAIP